MTPLTFSLVLLGVLLNAAAQLLLKAGTNRVGEFAYSMENLVPIGLRLVANPPILAGLACYVVSVVVWILALSRVPVSVAYPMLSIGYIVNALAAWMLFGESLSAQKLVGIGFIVVGVWLVARFVSYLPFARPTIDEAMVAAVAETLRSHWIASGPQVTAFERALSDHVGGRPVRVMTSATAAMQLALELVGVGPGDEVITPAQSFFATANVIERTGATTVFVDVDLATRNIDFDQAHAAVSRRTRVLLPTHYNAPIDPQRLADFASRHGVRVVEDAALAIGSRAGSKPVGATGDLVSFSFHPNKNLTTIEGGALVLNDAQEARDIERLRFHGITRLPDGTRDIEAPGSKYNMSDVSARLGVEQMRHLDAWCRRREALAMRYFDALAGEDLLDAQRLPPRDNPGHSWNMFTVLLPLHEMKLSRQEFIQAMHREGIGIGISYEAIHLTSYFRARGHREGRFPVAERIAAETATLPLYPEMADSDVDRVCETLARVVRGKAVP